MHKHFRRALSYMIHISAGNVLDKNENTRRGFQIFSVLFWKVHAVECSTTTTTTKKVAWVVNKWLLGSSTFP